jgi:hypothetical protein
LFVAFSVNPFISYQLAKRDKNKNKLIIEEEEIESNFDKKYTKIL